MAPPLSPTGKPEPASPPSDDSGGPGPTQEVPKPLHDVQQRLLSLEYALKNLSTVAADVQPPKPNDPPQGRIAEKV